MSTSKLIRAMADEYEKLYETSGKDALRKCDALKVAIEAFGYTIWPDEWPHFSVRFDWRLAEQLGIPESCWPDYAFDERSEDTEACEECKTLLVYGHDAKCSKYIECDDCGEHKDDGHKCPGYSGSTYREDFHSDG